MRKSTQSALWLTAFAAVGFLTVTMCSFMEGRTAEDVRVGHEVDTAVTEQAAKYKDLQARFDILADSSGEGAVLEAGMRYQEQQEARK